MQYIFKALGMIGVLLIALGIIHRGRKTQDYLYITGGVCLEAYSISVRDFVFIILQLIFLLTAIYDFFKIKKVYDKK